MYLLMMAASFSCAEVDDEELEELDELEGGEATFMMDMSNFSLRS
jgi:hypothetical protein